MEYRCLDGKYYSPDVTWDDQLDSETYFLCGDSDFPNHTPDGSFETAEFHAQYPLAAERYPID